MPLKQHSEKTHILGVGKSFLGIEQKPGAPAMDHYDLGIANFNADQVTAQLKARNLKIEAGGTQESFKFWDPDGFLVQRNGAEYDGRGGQELDGGRARTAPMATGAQVCRRLDSPRE